MRLRIKKRREAYAKLKFDNNEKHHQQLVLKNKKRREAYATEKISNHLQLKIVQFQILIRQVLNYEFCPIHQNLQPHSSNLQPLDESKSRVEFLLISRTSNFWLWVCVFYNLQSIFIYDPFNRPDTYDKSIGLLRLLFPKHTGNQKIIHCPYVECDPSKDSALNAISIATSNLNELQEKFLRSLHPSCYIEQYNPNVTCPSVQQQLNSDDCGFFAIAFQVSLIFGYDPQHLFYERSQMRKHLLNIFRTKTLENFPSIYKQ
ncbi:hypothetical protein AGLY_011490 [Aphis glycines]|uniref:Ubiquitin-like protease family profile domain-containing protein n=1 Tax=Aphis glycines TaxID=307491 RepID=A0A6G0TBN0_APHGL|nr:hypothetical protein AGLY_011490 [Aphis glycines]